MRVTPLTLANCCQSGLREVCHNPQASDMRTNDVFGRPHISPEWALDATGVHGQACYRRRQSARCAYLMKCIIKWIFGLVLVLLATGCEQETKEVAVVQQFSQIMKKWEDVIYVYGYDDNYNEAEVIADHFAKIYAHRTYRIKTASISRREYERQQKQLATK